MKKLFVLCAVLCGLQASAADEDLVAATARVHQHDEPVATAAATAAPAQAVSGGPVVYGSVDGAALRGYLARPAAAAEGLPGLIVIHEWWGLNDNIRQVTERLAAEGYVALAVDLYGGESAATPKAAMQLMQGLQKDSGVADDNLRQAFSYLTQTAGAPMVGSIGWCLGGRWSLRAALLMPSDIDATVIYYGSLTTDESELASLEMPILGNFASNDPLIPVETVNEFAATLDRLGKTVDVKIYEGAQHAFSNPSGRAYNAVAAEDAWQRTLAFFRSHLGGSSGG
jgi:carboxymethylenebutenolidase